MVNPKTNLFGTAGYILTKSAAARLLSQTTTLDAPVDVTMFNVKDDAFVHLRCLQMLPALCIQQQLHSAQPKAPASLVQPAKKKRAKRTLPQKLRHELFRPFRQLKGLALAIFARGVRGIYRLRGWFFDQIEFR